jgi:LPXTG-site transpeptidase (sortase) family protein
LVHRAHESAKVLGEMVRKAPSLPRAHISAKVLGEIALAALLLVTLAFSWRDGVPINGFDDSQAATQSTVRVEALPREQPAFGMTLPGLRNVTSWAKTTGELVSTRALIPTAPPVQLLIPSLNVHRPVEPVGVNRSRVMDLPVNAWNAGWFKGGPVPGAPGDAVIEGHAGYPDQPMIFGKLATLRPGDQIIVMLSDGSKRLFLVASMATLPVGSAPPGLASTSGPARLTLITCTGSFNDKTFSYSKRLLVEASYAGTV